MVILIIALILIIIYLGYRLRKLEKTAVTGKVSDETVTLHLNQKPFNQLKIKN